MIKYVLYVSEQTKSFSDKELLELLTQTKEDNEKNDITGLLFSYKQSFIEYLEGEAEKIDSLLQKIKTDYRHYNVTSLLEGKRLGRYFGDWNMAFAPKENEINDLFGYEPYCKYDFLVKEKNKRLQKNFSEVFEVRDVALETENSKHPGVEILEYFMNEQVF